MRDAEHRLDTVVGPREASVDLSAADLAEND
jgi:hypothetical protein